MNQPRSCLLAFLLAALAVSSSAFALPPLQLRRLARHGTEIKAKWSTQVDEFKEKLESTKVAAMGAVVGSFSFAPVGLLCEGFNTPQWEFSTDSAAVEGALFAIVYRYNGDILLHWRKRFLGLTSCVARQQVCNARRREPSAKTGGGRGICSRANAC